LIIGDLPAADLRHRLRDSGLRLRVGPIVVEVKSPFQLVEGEIARHYRAHEVASNEDFADFHVSIDGPGMIRRWVKRQAVFRLEGTAAFKPLSADQAFALFEWGLNWTISANCHQYLVIHSAVVERNGRAMLLPAPPGSGKSTLCAALVARGWRLLSDELALIDVTTGTLAPLPRPISLKNDSIAIIRRFWPGAVFGPIIRETMKGSVAYVRPPEESVGKSVLTADPACIVLPRYAPDRPSRLAGFSKAGTFMRLVESAFNYSLHGRKGFDALAAVVDASDCFEFDYDGSLEHAVSAFEEITDAQ
jgi:HprK-related kinase A